MLEDVYFEMIKRLGHELEKRSNDTAENWIYGTYPFFGFRIYNVDDGDVHFIDTVEY